MKKICLILSLLIVSGCVTSLSLPAKNIVDADIHMVQNCEYIGSFVGTSGTGNVVQAIGITNAKNEVREKAAVNGATHIMWTEVVGGYSPYVNGRAYICNK